MEVGRLSVGVEVTGLDKVSVAEKQTKQDTEKLQVTLDKLSGSLDKVSSAAKEAAASKTKLRDAQKQASESSGNLGRAVREATTSMLGSGIAAIALGTAIGNVLTQAVSRLVVGIAQSITQFSRWRNEMANVAAFTGRVGDELDFVIQQAQKSGRTIEETAQQWIGMGQAASTSAQNIEDNRKIFERWNETLAANRVTTVTGSLSQLGTAFGNLAEKSRATDFVAGILIANMNLLAMALNKLASLFPDREKDIASITRTMATAAKEEINFRKSIEAVLSQPIISGRDQQMVEAWNERLKSAVEEQVTLQRKLDVMRGKDPDAETKRVAIYDELIFRMDFEHRILKEKKMDQDIYNKAYEVELQLRQTGIKMSDKEREALGSRIIRNRQEEENWRQVTDLATNSVSALNGVVTGLGAAFTGQFAGLRGGITGLAEETVGVLLPATKQAMEEMEAAMIHNGATTAAVFAMKRQLAKQEQDQILHTASLAATAITSLFPKSKAAAIASAVINTAVGVTKALSSAPPPLNFINAALVAAAGAGQIAAIRSTSASGGGSVPSVGGGGSQAAAPAEASPGGRTVTVRMQGGQLFSSAQMSEFIDRLNEEVQNGATLIATETV